MSTSSGYSLHKIGLAVLRSGATRRAALRAAAARGRGIALVYHRITPEGAGPNEIPPNVTVSRFREHIQMLGDIGDIVPLSDLLLEPVTRSQVRIAITFDDDDQCHVDHALPALLEFGIPATFFLNGRSLHGLGGYWWMLLEQFVAVHGIAATRRALDVGGATARELAAACEGTSKVDLLAELVPDDRSALLSEQGIRALSDAGMQIGFHTLHHPVLTMLSGSALDGALRCGAEQLAVAAAAPVDLFAYPHGRANAYVAARARASGYGAAFRMGGRAIVGHSDRFMLGRLGPGMLRADELATLIALQLSKPL